MDPLHATLIQHEGMKLKPYLDTLGNMTIGVGRNLDGCGISQDEALMLLENDLTRCSLELLQFTWYINLDDVRKGVLLELVFNVGLTKTLLFKNMLAAIKAGDYSMASKELLDSAWATQVGRDRSSNMASRLLTGKYPK